MENGLKLWKTRKKCAMLNGTLATLIACMCRRCYGLAPAADKRII